MNYKDVGQNIFIYRKHNNLTQRALGKLIGKSEATIRKYEKGEVEIPNSVLELLSNALDVNISQLLSWDVETSINEVVYGYPEYKMNWIKECTGYKPLIDPTTEIITMIGNKGQKITLSEEKLEMTLKDIESFISFKFYELEKM